MPNLDDKLKLFLAGAALLCSAAHAGSVDGITYTTFGKDLEAPIFLTGPAIHIYRGKSDANPLVSVRTPKTISLFDEHKKCTAQPKDGWVHCAIQGERGWIRRSELISGAEYQPVTAWPVRYWLFVASSGRGGEESVMMEMAARKSPYLIAHKEFDNIFFHVLFDEEGNAISPKTGRRTGERIFVVNDEAYLAPADSKKRNGATWLFLNYFHEKLGALCPGRDPKSCRSAVNVAPNWPGIKSLYTDPPPQFLRKETDEPWFGDQEVAFARHIDPVRPLMYRVPDHVWTKADNNGSTDAQKAAHRAKLFCIADCLPKKIEGRQK